MEPILRFAPSPNGYLHLGHAYSALYTAQWARRLDGIFLLRIEDIDPERSREAFADAIIEDLHWLGLEWPEPVMRQSGRMAVYRAAAERLREMGLIYPCFCTRRDVAEDATGTDPDGAPLYAGRCRHLGDRDLAMRLMGGHAVQWRLKMDEAVNRAGALFIRQAMPDPDSIVEQVEADPTRWGDVVIQRKQVPTSYHLSVVVDDAAQGVTHVTRGQDLQAATDVHVLLQALLGLSSPIYTHHRLILDAGDEKLAKSRGSERLRDLRANGWTAADVYAALDLEAGDGG